MGKYKHHSGAIGGGVNLSKGKTPHDSLMKYMPIDDKASGLFKMKQPFEMGKMHRGPLDKHGKHSDSVAYKMDPMHNGIPGVQKDDFEQFASPASKKEDKTSKKEDKKVSRKTKKYLKKVAKGNSESIMETMSKGAKMRGPLNQEDPVKERIKPKKKKMEKKLTCKPGFVMHRGECIKEGSKVAVLGPKKP